jgi:hypothetical protein
MDERKKTIKALENRKQNESEGLLQLEQNVGKMLLERLGQGEAPPRWGYVAEYLRSLSETADLEEYIKRIEADVQRMKIVEAAIDKNEKLRAVQAKKLAERHTALGREILAEPDLAAYSRPYQTELEAITAKGLELEAKLSCLSDKGGEKISIFSRIGNSVQSMGIRSSLEKNQEQIRKLWETTGEYFTLADNPVENERLNALAAEVEELRSQQLELGARLKDLQAERAAIADTFNKEGNPARHIKSLEKCISQINDRIHELYSSAGKEASGAAGDLLEIQMSGEEEALIGQIALGREKLREMETRITSLEAAVAIDEEKEKIARFHKSIEERRRRIAEAELAITGFETRIAETQQHIEELSRLL